MQRSIADLVIVLVVLVALGLAIITSPWVLLIFPSFVAGMWFQEACHRWSALLKKR